MFFGLTNLPTTFQALINAIFADLIAKEKVAVHLDDILIWSTIFNEYWKIVYEVLCRLEGYNLYLRLKKCEFKQSYVDYLSDESVKGLIPDKSGTCRIQTCKLLIALGYFNH
jgi:hypothetical protein